MKILFIGGNGNISWFCTQKSIERGHEVWELNRSMTIKTRRKVQDEVKKITADIHDVNNVKKILEGAWFDVVIDFICFNEADAKNAIDLFKGKCKNFVFISSEAVYKRISKNLPYKENSVLNNAKDMDTYIAGKIKAEQIFIEAHLKEIMSVTIVRPAYTYDTIVPVSIGHNCFTAPQKFLEGYPALIAGDGTNLWTFTHSSDFASALIPLVENPDCVGETFHIASDEWLSWNEEMEILFNALGIERFNAIHIPYEKALDLTYFQSKDLMCQRMWHNIYDNSKIKAYVPGWKSRISFEEGINLTMEWLKENEVRRRINKNHSAELDKIYAMYM